MGRQERKSEKTKQIWMSIILAGIMIFSVFGVILGSQVNELKYNGFKFSQQSNYYVTKINGTQMPFYTMPTDVLYVNLSSITTNTLRESYVVMLTFNPNELQENIQPIELVRFDFAQYLGKPILNGVLAASTSYASLPIITCANATLKTPVIVFNVSDTSGISNINSCIYVSGRGADFIRFRDRILYSYFGVINDNSSIT